MKPDISEFSYGYALTEELTKRYQHQLTGAPEFPSLYAEGQTGAGYDVKIPQAVPLFLQFKLSHCLTTANAKEAYLLGTPYYRMYLRSLKHSPQHNLLLALEQKYKEVYYTAPKFHTSAELSEGYLQNQIPERSFLLAPSNKVDPFVKTQIK